MQETSKTKLVRACDFEQLYLRGKVLDIGAGDDLVCEHAEKFDIENGDANQILKYLPSASYDSVHSSHCLEHMHNTIDSLLQWWGLVKPGGFLVLVVPHEDLYEQGLWPSWFNSDHKCTFRLDKQASWSPASYEIRSLVQALPNVTIVTAEIHDHHLNYALLARHGEPYRHPTWLIKKLNRKIKRTKSAWLKNHMQRATDAYTRLRHVPIDQTLRGALAQIQIVAQKSK